MKTLNSPTNSRPPKSARLAAIALSGVLISLSYHAKADHHGPYLRNVGTCVLTFRLATSCGTFATQDRTLGPGAILDVGNADWNGSGCPEEHWVNVYDPSLNLIGSIPTVQNDSGHSSTQFIELAGACPGVPPINDQANLPPQEHCEQGMPTWSVALPFTSLWLADEPLGYQPALGPRLSLRLAYKQREFTTGGNTNTFSIGRKWNCSWLSYVSLNSSNNPVVLLPGGGELTFKTPQDYLTHARLTGDTTNGYTLVYPDGSKLVYAFIVTNNSGVFQQALMSEQWDPQAQKIRFLYSGNNSDTAAARLNSVVDGDGLTTSIYYSPTNLYSTNLITQVTDPYAHTTLAYNELGLLTSVTDVAGMASTFTYDGNDCVAQLTTPYGDTYFALTDSSGNDAPNGRSVLVTEADGSHQLFLAKDSATDVPATYGSVPTTSPFSNTFETTGLDVRNTFHWNRQQYAGLSTTTIASFTGNDFRKATMKHWLQAPNAGVGQTLSLLRQPSQDSAGSTTGQITWFDYTGKTNNAYEGAEFLPLLAARVLPVGTNFTRSLRNTLGYTTNEVTTHSASTASTAALLRTNILTYDSTDTDLLTLTNALGVQVLSNSYNAYHRVLTNFNALAEMTLFGYNGNQQLTSISLPSGLHTANVYFTNGPASNRLDRTIDLEILRTNSFTWANGLLSTHTDPRGATTTNTWDNLQRPLTMSDGRGTNSFTYDRLDLVTAIDRMGLTNSFGYNAIRQLIAATNANGVVTRYTYCACGALTAITNASGTALEQATMFDWDLQGNLLRTTAPDNYIVTRNYNSLGQLTNATDGLASITNWFNNQGLLVASSNAFGLVSSLIFDPLNRTTNSTDANSVTITTTYDNLGRALTRTYPDTGVESFGYTFNVAGLTSYTNQLTNNAVNYAYDTLGRKTNEVYPNITTNAFAYNSSDDLLTLTDGKNQTTTWNYDEFGRVTNKLDAANNIIFKFQYDPDDRPTNRWTPAKLNAAYRYDPMANLTNIVYSNSPSITMAYDVLNRMTNMVDGVGTTIYTYNAAGQVLSEDGPWADDTVSYTYDHRLRKTLSLLAPNASPWSQTYGYDAAERLSSVASPAGTFSYAYDAQRSTLPALLTLPNGAYITNSYDSAARMLSTVLKNSTNGILNSHSYAYSLASQRTAMTNTLGDYRNYTYDSISQIKTATGKEMNLTDRAHEQLGYAYDAAGNLAWRTNNALVQAFNVNNLNELTTETNSGFLTVAGTTTSVATNVTVTGSGLLTGSALLYADATWARTNAALPSGDALYTATAHDALGRSDTASVTVTLPGTNTFTYDLNGNLLSDGTRYFEYDDENELASVTVSNSYRSEFVYDGRMRRRKRREFSWVSGSWVTNLEVRYVYDGLLVIQERDTNSLPLVTYTRGIDLSGSFQGAGGIGGLLARTDHRLMAHAYYHSDGSGNVTCLINTNQVPIAKYLYDPFGNTLSQSGPLAEANVYRFSSKETHANSGMYYYGLRFYDPSLQRWLSRDPIGEHGGIGVYGYVGNDPINFVDVWGLFTAVIVGGPSPPGPGNSIGNPFGHIAIATTGNGVYSFGTGTPFGSSLTDYLNQQGTYRSSTVYILNTTPQQEQAIINYLKQQTGKPIEPYPDNCAARVNGALKAGGIELTKMGLGEQLYLDSGVDNFPSDIQSGIIHSTDYLEIKLPKGGTLPPRFLSGFNPRK
jgi:RHS repeat-associated protein